jgi:late competence protein required for DNA uptake (superfamily II DNA/RNA helicase)
MTARTTPSTCLLMLPRQRSRNHALLVLVCISLRGRGGSVGRCWVCGPQTVLSLLAFICAGEEGEVIIIAGTTRVIRSLFCCDCVCIGTKQSDHELYASPAKPLLEL